MKAAALLLTDLSTYAAITAIFAGFIFHRANPKRSVNCILALFLFTIAAWQLILALAHTTGQERFWAAFCLPIGFLFPIELALLHDACLDAHSSVWLRFRRNGLAILTSLAFLIAGAGKFWPELFPSVFVTVFRVVAIITMVSAVDQLRRRRRVAKNVNATEMGFFNFVCVVLAVTFVVVVAVPAPASSRVNAVLMIVCLAFVTRMLMSERVFDVAGTAKFALGYFVRGLIFFIGLALVLHLIAPTGSIENRPSTIILVSFVSIALAAGSDWLAQRLIQSFASRSGSIARERAVCLLHTGHSQAAILLHVQDIAKAFLRGLSVSAVSDDDTPADSGADGLRDLAKRVPGAWLSPETALRLLRGPERDEIMMGFARHRLGAIVKFPGRTSTIMFFIGQRNGGTKPITSDELDVLHDIAAIAGTAIDRQRAVEDRYRTRHLVGAGQLAANFSHGARNQIAAIQTLIETLRDGEESRLSPEYREAVYQETLALAANHDVALETAPFEAADFETKPVLIGPLLRSVAGMCRTAMGKAGGILHVAELDPRLLVVANERLLRQILLNLFRNSMQACEAAGTPAEIKVHVQVAPPFCHIDVADNGPGVPSHVHDRLFTPWLTTKTDGTGLGLSFCVQAARVQQGELRYLRGRGEPHACFQLSLRCPTMENRTPAGAVRNLISAVAEDRSSS